MKIVLPALFASVLAACGGGGSDAPQQAAAGPQTASATAAAPTPPAQPLSVSAPAVAAPAPPASPALAAASCTYLDMGGNPKPCDPRWPHANTLPPNGSTQDQVDGYNAMCLTMICMQTRCPDGQVLPFYEAYHVCPAKT